MAWGSVRARRVGPVWGHPSEASVEEALARVFEADPDEDEDEEEDDPAVPFGVLRVRHGWVGPSGPGAALRVPVRTDLPRAAAAVEIRLRADGRYVRSALARLGDRDRDLTLRPTLEPSPLRDELYVVTAFLPYAAIPPGVGETVLEAFLTEDEDPVEDALWPFPLPSLAERRVENALGAVVVAAHSAFGTVMLPRRATKKREIAALARAARTEEAIAQLFRFDGTGRAVLAARMRDDLAAPVASVAERLAAFVSPRALERVLAVLLSLSSREEAEIAFLDALAAFFGPGRRAHARMPAPAAGDLAAHYATLGFPPGASLDAVRAAYRRFARLYHPDRAQVAPPEAQALAHERMTRINRAHAALRAALSED